MNFFIKFHFFEILLVFALFLFFASFLIHPLYALNQDLGRYFKLGEIILGTASVPKINLFSYTHPGFKFINNHWLGGFILYFLSKLIGLKGLIVFKTIVILFAFALIFFLSFRLLGANKDFWLVFLIGLTAVGVMIERTDVRPEIFSFLIFSLYLYILYHSNWRWIWLLPLLQFFWVNIHIYFFLGPLFFAFLLAEKLFQEKNLKEFKRLLPIGFLIILSLFLNPNGAKGAFYPLLVMSNYGYSIVENQTPFFLSKFSYHPAIIFLFFLMEAFLILSLIANWRRVRLFEVLGAVFLSFFGFYAVRNFPIFALGAMPIIVSNFSLSWCRLKNFLISEIGPENISFFKKILSLLLIVFLGLGIFANRFKISLNTEAKAQKAVDFLIANDISGNMFNNFDVGGYLIYRLYPKKRVFVDNRPEAYPASFFQEVYIPMQEDEDVWKKYVAAYNINFVFFELSDITPWAQKFLKRIMNDKNWVIVYLDSNEVVLVKNTSKNKSLIEKYGSKYNSRYEFK